MAKGKENQITGTQVALGDNTYCGVPDEEEHRVCLSHWLAGRDMMKRLSILIVLGLCPVPCLGGAAEIELTEVVSGLDRPLFLTHAGDGSKRIFIVEQTGFIRILENGSLLGNPFLNISSGFNLAASGERGLLGLAFHPDYDTNGRFFINYTRNLSGQLQTVIQEHQVSGNPDIAGQNGEILLTFDQPSGNHNGGWLGFGTADGYLYISTGDGGGQDDPAERAQNLSMLLGKILRIDIDSGSPYGIPGSNPLVGSKGAREEIWAYGFRNPWRASFDPPSGRLFVGDVGQGTWEEVDVVEKSKNYGWDIMEAESCHEPEVGCDVSGLEPPINFYQRSLGHSVTGGHVYRGQQISSLVGDYIFGDYTSGRIWALTEGPGNWFRSELFDTSLNISSFGLDEDGELYAVHHGGSIFQFTSTVPSPDLEVTKQSQQENYQQSEEVVFQITVENRGPGNATAVTLTDALPTGLALSSVAPSQGSCSNAGNSVTCDLGSLNSTASAQVTLTAFAEGSGLITNTASALSVPSDGNNSNNSDDSTISIRPAADLSVNKTVESAQVELGSNIFFSIAVTNLGPSTATHVEIGDLLPIGLSPVSAPEPCTILTGPQLNCVFSSIGPNVTRTVDFSLRADQTGQFSNRATAVADEFDPQSSNNSDTAGVTVVATPDLEIRKIDLGPFVVGTTGYYQLSVENVGNAAATGTVTVTDDLPPSLALLSLHAIGWSCETEQASFSCLLQSSLEPGQSRELSAGVLAGPGAVPQVVNTVTVANSGDSNPDNNFASITTSVFEVGMLPRRFAQFALGDVFQVLILVANKGLTPWEGRGLLRQGNEEEWDSPWTLNGVEQTELSHFEIALPPQGTRKLTLIGDDQVREGFLDLIGTNSSVNSQVAVSFFYQVGKGALTDSVATFDTPPSKVLVFPVEKSSVADTGFAYAALDPGAAFSISATLIDQGGVEIGTVTWLYDGHDALFFTQLFDFLESFVGSLRIESEVSLFLTVVRVEQSGGGFQLTNVPPETGY